MTRCYEGIFIILLSSIFYISQIAEASQSEAVGFYSRGSLHSADALSPSGPGYLKLFTKRQRHWGTTEMVELLEDVAADISTRYPTGERLQIGDLSGPRGGKITRHASHQNGLDADLVYYRNNFAEQSPAVLSGFTEHFVRSGKITKNFDHERNWELMKSLVASGQINRIFVGPVIKKELCQYAKAQGEFYNNIETFAHLRPIRNHNDHLHVRIKCPQGDRSCKNQRPVVMRSGC